MVWVCNVHTLITSPEQFGSSTGGSFGYEG